MATDVLGFAGPGDYTAEIRNEISSVAINWYTNLNPLITRLARLPIGSPTFTIVTRKFRPRTYTLNAAIVTGDTSITLTDATGLLKGDIIELIKTDGTATERIEVTGDPTTTTAAIARAKEGTTAVANDTTGATTTLVVTLIGNSRTGAEVNQTANSYSPISVTQQVQNFMIPVQVGGSLQSTTAFVGSADGSTPLDQFKMEALQNLLNDMEYSTYYGKGDVVGTGTTRARQKGIRTLATTNLVTSPTNKAAYKPTDFIRDTVQATMASGGRPDAALCSPDFLAGLAVWGAPAQRVVTGMTTFGIPIHSFYTPLAPEITFVMSPLLKNGTVFVFNSAEVLLRMKRAEFWNPHGIRGDALEGDFISEMAVEVRNEYHHAWVEGITAFSAT